MDIERLENRTVNPVFFEKSPSMALNRDEVRIANNKIMGTEKKEGDGVDHDLGLDVVDEDITEDAKIIP